MGCFLAVLLIIIACLVSFFITAGLVAIICWAFGFMFTWKLALGVFAIYVLVKGIFNITVKKE